MKQPIIGEMKALLGYNVNVVPDRPKYKLPAEICPGVPWPPGFRDEINAWSASFLGMANLMRDGEVFFSQQDGYYMNPRTYDAVRKSMEAIK